MKQDHNDTLEGIVVGGLTGFIVGLLLMGGATLCSDSKYQFKLMSNKVQQSYLNSDYLNQENLDVDGKQVILPYELKIKE